MEYINEADKEVGKRLKEIRRKKKMSQKDLSDASEIQITSISAFENGRKAIGLSSLKRLVTALGCTYDDLLSKSGRIKIGKGGQESQAKDIATCLAFLCREGVLSRGIVSEFVDYVNPIAGSVGQSELDATETQGNASPYNCVIVPYPFSPDVLCYVNKRENDASMSEDIPDMSVRERQDREILISKIKKWPLKK